VTRRGGLAGLAILSSLIAGCSADGGGAPSVTETTAGPIVVAPLLIDEIDDALGAISEELGTPLELFEVNATAQLVNVIVALNDGTLAQRWLWFEGEATSRDPEPAQGNTFSPDAIDIDPEAVTSGVAAELADSTPSLFLVEGGPGGAVRYTVVVTSAVGGQLLVEVSGTGDVIAVDTS